MPTEPTPSARAAGLRRSAEARLRKRRENQPPKAGDAKSGADPRRLLHELQVHQIELEMQNAELQEARDRVETELEKYSELYDFAPVGYLTLGREGAIQEANLAGANLLGIARAALVKQRFGFFVSPEDRDVFDAFLQQVFESGARKECEVRLLLKGGTPVDVRIGANLFDSGQACRVAVTDITKHKLAEAATAQLAAIVTSSSDAIIGYDLNSIVTSWNAGAEKLFGYSAGEMVGGPIARLIPSDRQHEEEQIMGRTRKGESVEHFETLRVAQDGRLLDVSVTVSPIRYAAGKIAGASMVVRDITDRRQAEAKVRVSEIRYRRLFEAAHDGILLLDPGTCKITDANPFMTKLLGYPHDQLVGKELFEIGLLKDEAVSREMFRKLTRRHEVRYEDLPLESQGGRHQEVEVVASLYVENDVSVIQCNIRDITARKHAEDVLRRNEALFSALVEHAPVGVYVVDARFRLLQINSKARPVFGKVAPPLVGRDFSEIIHVLWPRRAADQVVERFRHTLKTGEPYQAAEFTERRKDTGVREIYEWQIQRVILPAGGHGVVCFFNNITARKRAEATQHRIDMLFAINRGLEEEIRRRRTVETALKKSEQSARQLLAQSRLLQKKLRQMSHQILLVQENQRKEISRELHDKISQLLIGINVQLGVFAQTAAIDPQGIRRTLAPVRRLVAKSVRVVHRFARELRPAALDDLGLIPALRSYIDDLPKRKNRRIEFAAFVGVEAMAMDKRTVLYRVAQEALTNVTRHSGASVVKVSIFKARSGVCLEVADNGRSFDVARLSSPRWSQRLGLTGMRERVEMVGGRFGIVSAPGAGTVVRAEIPFGNIKLGS